LCFMEDEVNRGFYGWQRHGGSAEIYNMDPSSPPDILEKSPAGTPRHFAPAFNFAGIKVLTNTA
jgi:hypothetical protein